MREARLGGNRAANHPAGGKPYLAFIDGLRTIAVLAVLFFHANREVISGGFVGVDVFFVISGFLITRICVADSFTLTSFWYSRSRRILPAYFCILLVTGVLSAIILLPSDTKDTASALLASPVLLQNFVFWKQSSYFTALETNPLLHTWTLAVEWQFYIFMPLLVMAFRSRRSLLIGAFAGVMLISFIASAYGAVYKPTPTFYLMPFRAWEFMIGSMLAIVRLSSAAPRHLATAVASVGLAMLALSIGWFSPDTIFPGAWALLPCVGAGAIIAGGLLNPSNPICAALSLRPIRAVGQASYSIYLVHWPLIVFTRYILIDRETPAATFAIIATSFGLGFLSWRFIEQPFRKKSPKGPALRWALSLGAIAMVGGISLATLKAHGFPQRFSQPVLQLEASKADQGQFRPCLNYEAPKSLADVRCRLSGAGPLQVVVWGDSTAAALAPGVAAASTERNLSAAFIGTDSCPPVAGMEGGFLGTIPLCRRIQAKVPAMLAASPVDTLIIEAAWRGHLQRHRATFEADVRKSFATYGKLARHVVIVGPVPGANTSVPSAEARMIAFRRTANLQPGESSRRDVIAANAIVRSAAAANGFSFVDLMADLCQPTCVVNVNGAPVYFDGGHITATTARYLVARHASTMFAGAP